MGEYRLMGFLARPRWRGHPLHLVLAVSIAVGGTTAVAEQETAVSAEVARCDGLPEARQALCWMVVACGALPNESRREECYRTAADYLQLGEAPASTEEHEPASVSQSTLRQESGTPETAIAAPAAADPSAAGESPPSEPPPTTAGQARASQVTTTVVAREVLELPRRFTAQVTAKRVLVRNRQLLALDDTLLFETDEADTANIEAGDRVEVVKASSGKGRKYQITGPAKRAVLGLRIRCERLDLSADNQRKCSALLSDGETTPN